MMNICNLADYSSWFQGFNTGNGLCEINDVLANGTLKFKLVLMEPLHKALLMEDMLAFTNLLYPLVLLTHLWAINNSLVTLEWLHADAANVVFRLLLFVEVFLENNLGRFLFQQMFDVLFAHLLVYSLLVVCKIICKILLSLGNLVDLLNHLLVSFTLWLAKVVHLTTKINWFAKALLWRCTALMLLRLLVVPVYILTCNFFAWRYINGHWYSIKMLHLFFLLLLFKRDLNFIQI